MATTDLKDWAEALAEHMAGRRIEPIPPGWKSIEDLQKIFEYTRPTISRMMSRMVREGRAEKRKFYQLVKAGKNFSKYGPRRQYTRPAPYYKLKKISQKG
jgi:predicted transcriptional regulator